MYDRRETGVESCLRLLPDPITSFKDELRSFDAFGAKTREIVEDNIPYFINEFWTSGQRRAHSIHEVQLPRLLQAAIA